MDTSLIFVKLTYKLSIKIVSYFVRISWIKRVTPATHTGAYGQGACMGRLRKVQVADIRAMLDLPCYC